MRNHNLGILTALLILGATALWAATGCNDATVWERTVTISGQVADAETQEPLDSAWIVVGADTLLATPYVFSDSLGRFSVQHGVFGLQPVYVGRDGYMTSIDTLLVKSDSDVTGLYYELGRAQ
jgi:hypothetical protein